MTYINPYKNFQGAMIPNAIMQCRDISQSAKLMWARLAQHAGQDGRCFPKIEKLASEIGMSKSMARKVLKELKEKMFIEVKHPTGKAKLMHFGNEYFFLDHPVFHDPETVLPREPKNGLSGEPRNGPSLESPKMGSPIEENHRRESLQDMSENFSNSSDECFEEIEKQEKPAKKFNADDLVLSEKIFQSIIIINPTVKKPNFENWANVIRLMREQDKRTHTEIWKVFSFANKDQFWRQNILSPAALRKNYPRIAGKFIESGGSLQPATKPKEPEYRCSDCAFLPKNMDICRGKGNDAPNAPSCNLFRHSDPEIDEMMQKHITRLVV